MGSATADIQAIAEAVKDVFGVSGVTVRWSTGGTFVAATGKWSASPQSASITADEGALQTFTMTTGSGDVRAESRVYHIKVSDLVATAIPGGIIRQGMSIIGTDGVERIVATADLQCENALYRVTVRREKGRTA